MERNEPSAFANPYDLDPDAADPSPPPRVRSTRATRALTLGALSAGAAVGVGALGTGSAAAAPGDMFNTSFNLGNTGGVNIADLKLSPDVKLPTNFTPPTLPAIDPSTIKFVDVPKLPEVPPAQNSTPPPQNSTPPQNTPPPAENSTPPPPQNTPPPAQNTPPPAENSTPPPQNTPPPAQNTAPPAENPTPPPAQNTPPAAENTPPPAQNTAPPAENSTPPPQNTPPPAQNTPPLVEAVPEYTVENLPAPLTDAEGNFTVANTSVGDPALFGAPSTEGQQPPAQNTPPPPQNTAPPAENSTPPPQDTPPPAQNTPPPAQNTPPLAENSTQPPPPVQNTPSVETVPEYTADNLPAPLTDAEGNFTVANTSVGDPAVFGAPSTDGQQAAVTESTTPEQDRTLQAGGGTGTGSALQLARDGEVIQASADGSVYLAQEPTPSLETVPQYTVDNVPAPLTDADGTFTVASTTAAGDTTLFPTGDQAPTGATDAPGGASTTASALGDPGDLTVGLRGDGDGYAVDLNQTTVGLPPGTERPADQTGSVAVNSYTTDGTGAAGTFYRDGVTTDTAYFSSGVGADSVGSLNVVGQVNQPDPSVADGSAFGSGTIAVEGRLGPNVNKDDGVNLTGTAATTLPGVNQDTERTNSFQIGSNVQIGDPQSYPNGRISAGFGTVSAPGVSLPDGDNPQAEQRTISGQLNIDPNWNVRLENTAQVGNNWNGANPEDTRLSVNYFTSLGGNDDSGNRNPDQFDPTSPTTSSGAAELGSSGVTIQPTGDAGFGLSAGDGLFSSDVLPPGAGGTLTDQAGAGSGTAGPSTRPYGTPPPVVLNDNAGDASLFTQPVPDDERLFGALPAVTPPSTTLPPTTPLSTTPLSTTPPSTTPPQWQLGSPSNAVTTDGLTGSTQEAPTPPAGEDTDTRSALQRAADGEVIQASADGSVYLPQTPPASSDTSGDGGTLYAQNLNDPIGEQSKDNPRPLFLRNDPPPVVKPDDMSQEEYNALWSNQLFGLYQDSPNWYGKLERVWGYDGGENATATAQVNNEIGQYNNWVRQIINDYGQTSNALLNWQADQNSAAQRTTGADAFQLGEATSEAVQQENLNQQIDRANTGFANTEQRETSNQQAQVAGRVEGMSKDAAENYITNNFFANLPPGAENPPTPGQEPTEAQRAFQAVKDAATPQEAVRVLQEQFPGQVRPSGGDRGNSTETATLFDPAAIPGASNGTVRFEQPEELVNGQLQPPAKAPVIPNVDTTRSTDDLQASVEKLANGPDAAKVDAQLPAPTQIPVPKLDQPYTPEESAQRAADIYQAGLVSAVPSLLADLVPGPISLKPSDRFPSVISYKDDLEKARLLSTANYEANNTAYANNVTGFELTKEALANAQEGTQASADTAFTNTQLGLDQTRQQALTGAGNAIDRANESNSVTNTITTTGENYADENAARQVQNGATLQRLDDSADKANTTLKHFVDVARAVGGQQGAVILQTIDSYAEYGSPVKLLGLQQVLGQEAFEKVKNYVIPPGTLPGPTGVTTPKPITTQEELDKLNEQIMQR